MHESGARGLDARRAARETPAVPRLLLVIPFLLVFGGVAVGGHWYLAKRLVAEAALPPGVHALGMASIAAAAATLVLQPIAERLLRPPWSRLIAWPASLWMGLFFYLVLGVAFTDLLFFVGGIAGPKVLYAAVAVPNTAPPAAERIRSAGVLAVALAFVAAGVRGARRGPVLERLELWLERWPAALDGFRIVQISDIHIGPILGRRFARELTDRVNALAPDLVALTGDLVDGSVSRLRDEVTPFADLRARHGLFFVTGNHDHYSGASRWTERIAELGFEILRNRRVTIESGGARFELAGVDDHRSGYESFAGENLDAALRDLPPGRAVVLLAHDPTTFKKASGMGIDLQISGHTHGGQIWPFAWLVRLAVPFVAGHYRRGRAQLYVSRGTGFWGPPMRLRAPAEITEIRLRSGAEPVGRAAS
jgi:predicted MPP superfamily phosphohydrolase